MRSPFRTQRKIAEPSFRPQMLCSASAVVLDGAAALLHGCMLILERNFIASLMAAWGLVCVGCTIHLARKPLIQNWILMLTSTLVAAGLHFIHTMASHSTASVPAASNTHGGHTYSRAYGSVSADSGAFMDSVSMISVWLMAGVAIVSIAGLFFCFSFTSHKDRGANKAGVRNEVMP